MSVDEKDSPTPSETMNGDSPNEPAAPSPTADSHHEERPSSLEESSSSLSSPKFTFESDISNVNRKIWVVTTASLPWRTGTAINALMRALFLTRGRPKDYVTLMVPWLDDVQAREALYGKEHSFQQGGKKEQEEWIREYCRTRANCPDEEKNLRIEFYNGVYHTSFGSIFPTVDICSLIPKEEADIAILDEPEHLNWFRVPACNLSVAPENVDVLGWAHKFHHVVGILHTNYEEYVKKYGMGTSLLTGPALNALSALVIKAYCHRVIRLSDALPSLVARKEVTSNVHGVRPEFLHPPLQIIVDSNQDNNKYATIYFVGKLIWAKGFEEVLELQERYRLAKGYYFEMDIYGGGKDEKAIKRAFFGRHGRHRQLSPSTSSVADSETKDDKLAAEIFDKDESLRSLLCERHGDAAPSNQGEQQENVVDNQEQVQTDCSAPLDVLNDLSKKTLGTGVETAGAALQLVESAMQCGLGAFSKTNNDDDDDDDCKPKEEESSSVDKKHPPPRTFSLGPRIAAFKWRRHPIPARFLGVKDHIELRDIAKQKIFLNMSTSEVLCTTSAEALAMGKFVVLPKHPSNEFFLQFPNCLAYNTLDDCVDKLLYAESHEPEPLSEEHRYMLSWDGATERLFQASGITERQAADLAKTAGEDLRAARFHVETARKSNFVRGLFNGKILGGNKNSAQN